MPEHDEFSYNILPELDFNQLFVYVDFIKPGKQQYFVNYQNAFVEPAPVLPPKKKEEHNIWNQQTTTNESDSEEGKPKKIT